METNGLGVAALHRGAAISLGAVLLLAPAAASAQFQRIVPPPPCAVPAALQVRRGAPAGGSARPVVVVEPFDVTGTDRRALHIPWSLTTRLRDRLQQSARLTTASEGSWERSLYEAAGNPDSAAVLLGGGWIIRGRASSSVMGTELVVTLLRAKADTPAWNARYQLPSQSLASVENLVLEEVLPRIATGDVALPAAPRGAPRSSDADLQLSLAQFTLREPSLSAADSARRVLERAFASDTSSPQLAVALADAYLAVLERGGANPPVVPAAALRRVEDLVQFALARDSSRGDAWTTRARAARVRDPVAFTGVLEAHAKALARDRRSAEAMHQLAMTYVALGEDGKAASELRRALGAEPERGATFAELAGVELRARRYRQACAYSNAAVAAAPFEANGYAVRARARLHLGQARDAYADAETAARLSGEPWTEGLRLITEIGAGNRDGAVSLGRVLAQRHLAPDRVLTVRDASMLALGFVRLGEARRALDILERAQPRGRSLATALRDPDFDSIRKQPRFTKLVAQAAGRGGEY